MIILEAIANLKQLLAIYVAGYTDVDQGAEFHLLSEEYANLTREITKKHTSISDVAGDFDTALSAVKDLLSTHDMRQLVSNSKATGTAMVDKLQKTIKTQNSDWLRYEKDNATVAKDAVALIEQVTKVIAQYSGKAKVTMANYQPGSFSKSELGAELLATYQGVKQFDGQQAKTAASAQKIINAQWKNHLKMVSARKEAVKRQGWTNLRCSSDTRTAKEDTVLNAELKQQKNLGITLQIN